MNITVLGGGIGGLCTAIALENLGYTVDLFESASAFKAVGAGIALSPNALDALAKLGVLNQVLEVAREYQHGTMLTTSGKVIAQMDLPNITKRVGGKFVSLHRHDLHQALASQVQKTKVHFNKKCVRLIKDDHHYTLFFEDGSTHSTEVLIAADGIHSAVRKYFLPNSIERYSGQTCWRGICHSDSISLKGVSESWGKGKRFGMVPLSNNRIYWFAVLDSEAKQHSSTSKEELIQLFSEFHHPILPILKQTEEAAIFQNDLNDLLPITSFAFDQVLLLGDAAHATTPNMGQGACMAIEDAAMLQLVLQQHSDIRIAFKSFEKNRIARTTKIVNLSYRFGKIAQTQNILLIAIRNTFMRLIPQKWNAGMYDFVFGYKVS